MSLVFQVQAIYGQNLSMAQASTEAKDFRDFIYKMKPELTSPQFLFFTQDLKNLAQQKMPRIVELDADNYEIRSGESVHTFKITSREKKTYLLNGKPVTLGSGSLTDKYERLKNALAAKAGHAGIWHFIVPEAAAIEPVSTTIAIVGLTIAAVSLFIAVKNDNKNSCDAVMNAATNCIDLSERLVQKLTETENFIKAQKKYLGTNDIKSPEIAAKIADTCKDLNKNVSEVRSAIYKSESADEAWAWCKKSDRANIKTCLSELRKSQADLKAYVKELCTPATTTAEAPIESGTVLTSDEGTQPAVIKESLEKAASPPAK
jgi:hypothetical protein